MTTTGDRPPAGRFAPSPSGDLHLGNLRTALLAWLFARSSRRRFLLRMEDLDRVRPGAEARQLADLAAIGLDWDGPVVHQSERLASTPTPSTSSPTEAWPTSATAPAARSSRPRPRRTPRRAPTPEPAATSPTRNASGVATPADRPRCGCAPIPPSSPSTTCCTATFTGVVDDMVLRRGDGTPAYNLAVVVDDAAQGIDQVVRGDDLLPSAHARPISAPARPAGTRLRPRPARAQHRAQAPRQARRGGDAP